MSQMPYSIWPKYRFGFTGISNGLDSWAWSSVTSLLFVYVADVVLMSFCCWALPVSLVNPRQNWIRESRFGFAHWMDGSTESNQNPDTDSANSICHKYAISKGAQFLIDVCAYGWLGSWVVSVLDSDAVAPGFKLLSGNSLTQTVHIDRAFVY